VPAMARDHTSIRAAGEGNDDAGTPRPLTGGRGISEDRGSREEQ
jgi:hypothetical protein